MSRKWSYMARKESDELGRVRLLIVRDDDQVLLKPNDEFVTVETIVPLFPDEARG